MNKLLLLLFLAAPVQLFSMHMPHPGWPPREKVGSVGNFGRTVENPDGSIVKESRDEFPEYRVLSRATIFGDNGEGRVEVFARLVNKGNGEEVDTRREDFPTIQQGRMHGSAITRALLHMMQRGK